MQYGHSPRPEDIRGHNGKANPLVIVAVALLVAVIVVAIYFLVFSRTPGGEGNEVRGLIPSDRNETSRESDSFASDDAREDERLFEGESFSIIVPPGWSTANQLPGTLVTIMNVAETHADDPAAQRVNFKSYIAVTFDETRGRSFDDIIAATVNTIAQAIPSAAVLSESDDSIDEAPARLLELSVRQQEVDYRVLVVVLLRGERYYVISGNTTEKKWPEYRNLFYETARSFTFR